MELETYFYWIVLKFFFPLNIKFMSISEPHKSLIQSESITITGVIDYCAFLRKN